MIKLLFICIFLLFHSSQSISLEQLVQQFSGKPQNLRYDVKTVDGINMDCLKILTIDTKSNAFNLTNTIGVFHSSKEQKDSGYNALYVAELDGVNWIKRNKLSERGSQGTIFQITAGFKNQANFLHPSHNQNGGQNLILVLYELQNHQKGNTIAIRLYKSLEALFLNNFVYEYQLNQECSQKKVINLGTPSVDEIILTQTHNESIYNNYKLNIKFHYSPDGRNDYPGYGFVNINPLRDFVDKQAKWVGGCKENYTDWVGFNDTTVLAAIRKIGIDGKIGQRDMFELKDSNGVISRYYLYETNLYSEFDWKNWRIVLYSVKEARALPIPFSFNQTIDIANPHITISRGRMGPFFGKNSGLRPNKTAKVGGKKGNSAALNVNVFYLTFFLPSEGIKPGTGAAAGSFMANVQINL